MPGHFLAKARGQWYPLRPQGGTPRRRGLRRMARPLA